MNHRFVQQSIALFIFDCVDHTEKNATHRVFQIKRFLKALLNDKNASIDVDICFNGAVREQQSVLHLKTPIYSKMFFW